MPHEAEKPIMTPEIKWNPQVKLIVSDVDETIADNFTPAKPEMVKELTSLLEDGIILFPVSGASLKRMQMRFIDEIPAHLRHQIIVAHCSGVEVWGFNKDGTLKDKPYYSTYDSVMSESQKTLWREKTQQIVEEFQLKTHEPMTEKEFRATVGDDPRDVIIEDRGPQITLEILNGFHMTEEQAKSVGVLTPDAEGVYDFRMPILRRAEELFKEAGLPITPRIAGMWAVDFAIEGVNKTTAVKYVVENDEILGPLGLSKEMLKDPNITEIYGDRFSGGKGTDWLICEALPPGVRAINFRQENPSEFPEGYNIQVWNGEYHLHDGLLEYLKERPRK